MRKPWERMGIPTLQWLFSSPISGASPISNEDKQWSSELAGHRLYINVVFGSLTGHRQCIACHIWSTKWALAVSIVMKGY
jgi:hypothetical protein